MKNLIIMTALPGHHTHEEIIREYEKGNVHIHAIPGRYTHEAIIRAYEEGLVGIEQDEENSIPTYDEVTNLILEYVRRLVPYVSPEYADCIDKIWDRIVTDVHIRPHLTIKKGDDKGMPNKYHITYIVSLMSLDNIYRKDLTTHDLHLILEQTKVRNKYYTSMSKYEAKGKELEEIKFILGMYPTKKK